MTAQTEDEGAWPAGAPVEDANYVDIFRVPAPNADAHSPEVWMRMALEGAPVGLRWFIQLGWRLVLGFPRWSGATIAGWPIAASSEDTVVLEQRSRLLAAALLLHRQNGQLVWRTRVRYRSRAAVAVWAVVGRLHRRIVPFVVAAAVRRASIRSRPRR